MKLRERFNNILFVYAIALDQSKINRCVEIAEDFAIGFLSWTNTYKHYADKTNEQLMEIYKKEKGL